MVVVCAGWLVDGNERARNEQARVYGKSRFVMDRGLNSGGTFVDWLVRAGRATRLGQEQARGRAARGHLGRAGARRHAGE